MRPYTWFCLACVPVLTIAVLTAQQAKTFKARLAPVPIDVAMQATIAGSGIGFSGPDRHEARRHWFI